MIVSKLVISSVLLFAPQSAPIDPALIERVAVEATEGTSALDRMLAAIERERMRWSEQGPMIESGDRDVDAATRQALARESAALLERLDPSVITELRQREAGDSRRHLTGDDLLRCAMFAAASEAFSVELARPDADRTRDDPRLQCDAILVALRAAATQTDSAASGREALPANYREVDPCVRGFRLRDRGLPYLAFATLEANAYWERAGVSRATYLERLLYLGEENEALGGCVLLALSRPLANGVVAALDPKQRVASHLAGVERGCRPLGFEPRHLDVALDIEERAQSDQGALGPVRREYAKELLVRIRHEISRSASDMLQFGDPRAEIEAWRGLAKTLPWPELKQRARELLRAVATDSYLHPADEALRRLNEKRASGTLTPEERVEQRRLIGTRYLEVRESLIGMLAAFEPEMPANEAIAMQLEAAKELTEAGKGDLCDNVLARSLGRSFARDPQAAKDLLDRARLQHQLDSDAFAHRVAIEALLASDCPVSGARESALAAGSESLDGGIRFATLANLGSVTAQESEQLASSAIDDLTQNPAFAKGSAREQLMLGLVSHVVARAQQDDTGKSWASETTFRSFERGLWQERGSVPAADAHLDALAATLTESQLQALDSMGRLPAWVKERRPKR